MLGVELMELALRVRQDPLVQMLDQGLCKGQHMVLELEEVDVVIQPLMVELELVDKMAVNHNYSKDLSNRSYYHSP